MLLPSVLKSEIEGLGVATYWPDDMIFYCLVLGVARRMKVYLILGVCATT